ncbi:MAG: hypothetical protein WB688_02235 [Trebonia sp.]
MTDRSVATFTTYAEALEPDHAQMKLYEMGTLTRLPGELLGDMLRRTGGVYGVEFPLTPEFRRDIRETAELTSDAELREIAERSAVPVSLEHLRHLDPLTRIVLGARLWLTPRRANGWAVHGLSCRPTLGRRSWWTGALPRTSRWERSRRAARGQHVRCPNEAP